MKVISPSFEILSMNLDNPEDIRKLYRSIEMAGRTCYKSNDRITSESAAKFVKKVVENGHEAMLEHASMTVRFIVDRGVSHEIVRHRVASFAQESTRYCNYSKDKFGKELTFIKPPFFPEGSVRYKVWAGAMLNAEDAYMYLLENGATPQEARSVLPNSLKTELIMTANMREWRHFFQLRAAGVTGAPHPQMAEVAVPLLKTCQKYMPELFGDIEVPNDTEKD